jgi:hypothetical protein
VLAILEFAFFMRAEVNAQGLRDTSAQLISPFQGEKAHSYLTNAVAMGRRPPRHAALHFPGADLPGLKRDRCEEVSDNYSPDSRRTS